MDSEGDSNKSKLNVDAKEFVRRAMDANSSKVLHRRFVGFMRGNLFLQMVSQRRRDRQAKLSGAQLCWAMKSDSDEKLKEIERSWNLDRDEWSSSSGESCIE